MSKTICTILEMVPLFLILFLILKKELSEVIGINTVSILTALVKAGMSPIGACAMGGNMQAESAMISINLQDAYQEKLGFNDNSYTSAVDNGSYTRERFIYDKAGYGLCQWTSSDRKANLYDCAKQRKTSIGDEAMQVDFCLWELQNQYASLWSYLCNTSDIATATSRICKEFERPAENNINTRTRYAQKLYNDYGPILEQITHGEPEAIQSVNTVAGTNYTFGIVKFGDHTPDATFLMSRLNRVGYDVLWYGLDNCIRDFQQKCGLEVDGICGAKTWSEILKNKGE